MKFGPPGMTDSMWFALRSIARDGNPYGGCHGQSEYGGRTRTLAGLLRRGLIDHDCNLTSFGRESLEARYKS